MKEYDTTNELIDKFWKMIPLESIGWIKEHSLETARMLWYLIGYCGKDKEEK